MSGRTHCLPNACHGANLLTNLDEMAKSGAFSDVKLVCAGGGNDDAASSSSVFWTHRLLLASVSPFLKQLLLQPEHVQEPVLTVHLPHTHAVHLRLVLDYVYTGAMFLCAAQLAPVVDLIELLQMKCGVSVSKRRVVPPNVALKGGGGGGGDSSSSGGKGGVSSKAGSDEWVKQAEFGGFEQLTSMKVEETAKDTPMEVGASTPAPSFPPSPASPKNALAETATAAAGSESPDYPAVEVIEDESDDDESDEYVHEVGEHDDDDDDDLPMWSNGTDGNNANGVDQRRRDATPAYPCTMCDKIFQHATNLKVHLQGHLSTRAQLRNCSACNRNFRSTLEHELHTDSHKFGRFLRKQSRLAAARKDGGRVYRLCRGMVVRSARRLVFDSSRRITARQWLEARRRRRRRAMAVRQMLQKEEQERLQREAEVRREQEAQAAAAAALKPGAFKVRMKVGLDRVLQLQQEQAQAEAEASAEHTAEDSSAQPENETFCAICQKNFCSKSSLKRHMKTQHKKKRQRKAAPAQAPPPPKRHKSEADPALEAAASPRQPSTWTPTGRRPTEDDLTCPTCDKTFPARSIFERHLKTSRHGGFSAAEDGSPTPSYIPPPNAPPLPHFNQVVQATMDLGGRQVNKYDCHLCGQVFLRVKDLEKHRAKMLCSAYRHM